MIENERQSVRSLDQMNEIMAVLFTIFWLFYLIDKIFTFTWSLIN